MTHTTSLKRLVALTVLACCDVALRLLAHLTDRPKARGRESQDDERSDW